MSLPNGIASALWNLSDLLHGEDHDLDRSDRLLITAVASGLPEGPRYLIGRAIGYQRADLRRSLAIEPDQPEPAAYLERLER